MNECLREVEHPRLARCQRDGDALVTLCDVIRRPTLLAYRAAQRTGAITVLVSHRFSTVPMADLIVVVGAGRVLEVGSHAELMARAGRYAELYGLQARGNR